MTWNDIIGKMSFKNSKLEGFLWYSGTKMINLGLWDHFSHFHRNPTISHENAENCRIPIFQSEMLKIGPPGHRKMQVYWFASIILSKIALIGLQGVKWWIWAFLRFYGLYAFNAYGVNLRKYGWSLKKFMLRKCQKDMGFCFG